MLEDLSELLLEVARFRKVVFQIIGRLGLDPGSLHCNRQPGTPLTPEHLPLAPASLGNEGPSICRPPLALTPARVRRAPSRINATGLRPYQTSASAPVAVRRSRCALIRGRRIS